jgi:hypothetical protein
MRVRRPPLNEVQAAVQLNRLSRHIRIADSYQHCLRHLLSRAKPPHRDSRAASAPSGSIISTATNDGATALTVIPSLASRVAYRRVSPSRLALEAL